MATVGNITPDSPGYMDLVDACRSQGICWACRKPVLDGQPRYGVTQAHWECQEPFIPKAPSKAEFDALSKRVDAAFDRAQKAIDDLVSATGQQTISHRSIRRTGDPFR